MPAKPTDTPTKDEEAAISANPPRLYQKQQSPPVSPIDQPTPLSTWLLRLLCLPFCTAIFNFQSLLLVILLFICTSTYLHSMAPSLLDRTKDGPLSVFWKSARIGERLSPYVSLLCAVMAVSRPYHNPSMRTSCMGKEKLEANMW
ncbi:hypothetical protein PMZ80_005735 [Knufia obscura]|uniref:Protein kish n=1 Tax=Knufia obscura TaxID=1635080 RepID=A0ABR0RNW9_9EURO|nr:hypothetical protein PMZ80_005735 [Knufia obscura]